MQWGTRQIGYSQICKFYVQNTEDDEFKKAVLVTQPKIVSTGRSQRYRTVSLILRVSKILIKLMQTRMERMFVILKKVVPNKSIEKE